MNALRKICVVTGTRAEFGLLETVMRAIAAHPALQLQVVACGAHLVTGTWRAIPQAGFRIDARVPMQRAGQVGRFPDAAALGRGISGFARVFERLAPDIVLGLGDRIELLAAASAAAIAGVRVAHLHGGDRAEGVADESIRHAVSKLAHLHFPATAQSRRRLIRLGEDPQVIFCHGSPAIDALRGVTADPDAPQVLVLHHPIGAGDAQEAAWMEALLAATAGRSRWVLAPNLDPGREGILAAIRGAGIEPIQNLERTHWLAALKGARVLVGNSSAGLIEAAALGTPTVNIGPRQGGRERPASVIDVPPETKKIASAIRQALRLDTTRLRHPYGRGRTGEKITQTLATLDLQHVPVRKQNAY